MSTENSSAEDGALYAVPEKERSTARDNAPKFALSLDELKERGDELKRFAREQMIGGEDYGIIPGGSKPTLFKPGAEKLNAVFGLSPLVETTHRIEEWSGNFVCYEVKVTLINRRTNAVEAEGLGSCNSKERRYKNQDAANVANTVLKMAKKRALVDATLSATRASSIFTQDLEDIDTGSHSEPQRRDQTPERGARNGSAPTANYAQRGEARPQGGGSGETLSDAQHRAILAIAGRVFGRHSREEDLDRMVNKPLEQLTKGEASSLIEQLRGMLGESPETDNNHGRSRR